MARPTKGDWTRLKRLGRYLAGRPRLRVLFEWQSPARDITAYSDADWAGDKTTRKSTSGGCLMVGNHLIKGWAKTQALIALSSAESELYAVLRTAAETLGFISIGKDMNYKLGGRVWGDASEALGIIHRRGLGRTRHIDTSLLWVQQVAAERRLAFAKVLGRDNPADLFTKHLDAKTSDKHVSRIKCEYAGGRSAIMPELHRLSISWNEYIQSRDTQYALTLGRQSKDMVENIISGHGQEKNQQRLSLRSCTRRTPQGAGDETKNEQVQDQTVRDHLINHHTIAINQNYKDLNVKHEDDMHIARQPNHCAIRYIRQETKVLMGQSCHPHDNSELCHESSQLDQILFSKMYRGSMSVRPNFSRCLGAASEGGFRDIQGSYTYRHEDRFNEHARAVVWMAS